MRRQSLRPRTLFVAYAVVIAIATMAKLSLGPTGYAGQSYPQVNNFSIFASSFHHLVDRKDLYIPHPADHFDLYKYSPSFALFMAPFGAVPRWSGLLAWNLLNGLVLLAALLRVPMLSERGRVLAGWFVLIEMLTSVQSAQSNALIAGLLLLAAVQLERDRPALGSLCIVSTIFIKLFGAVALLVPLLYPRKVRSSLQGLAWAALLFLLPLVVVPWGHLVDLYRSWQALLVRDLARPEGVSVSAWLEAWFQFQPPRQVVTAAGAALLCAPLARREQHEDARFRLLFLAAVMIWVVVFNHKAESPTFVIAMCGAALWYFQDPRSPWKTAMVVLAFVLTTLSPTEVFPRAIRAAVVKPYVLKAFPCIVIWLWIIAELCFRDWVGRRDPPSLEGCS